MHTTLVFVAKLDMCKLVSRNDFRRVVLTKAKLTKKPSSSREYYCNKTSKLNIKLKTSRSKLET